MQRQNRHSRSDFSVGLQTLKARVSNAVRSLIVMSAAWLVAWLTLWWVLSTVVTTPSERYMAAKWGQSCVLADALFFLPGLKVEYVTDQPHRVAVRVLCDSPYLAGVTKDVWSRVHGRMQGSALVALGVVMLLALAVRFLGARLRGDHILRGGELVRSSELRQELRRRRIASKLRIGDVPLVLGSETQHISLIGTTGVGKTVALHSLQDQIGRTAPMVIYDTKGDLLSVHGDLSRDQVLNPVDARCPQWTPWNEIETSTDAALVAEAWLPQRVASSDPFWMEAARMLLADILTSIPGAVRTNAELYRVCTQAPTEELKNLLVGTASGRLFDDPGAERMRESVRNTLAVSMRALTFLDPTARAGAGFSMRLWVREAVASGSGSRVFLGCSPQHAAAITPLIAVLIEAACSALMSLGPDRERRVGFIVDEFPTLPPMNYLQRLMAEGRAYGAFVILAAQAHTQIRKTYGAEAADTISSLCSTHIVFRVNETDSAERASKLLGEAEFDEGRESDSHGKAGTTANLGNHRVLRRAVLASEVLALPNLHAYLKLAGDLPVALVKFKPQKRARVLAPFQLRAIDQTAFRSMPSQPAASASGDDDSDQGLI